MSCSSPNVQQIDARLKPYVVPEAGYHFVIGEYGQAQLRILAELSQDPVMLEAYQNQNHGYGGDDLHTKTAKAILQKQEVTPHDRKLAKGVNFGLAFGLSAYGLRRDLKSNYGIDLSEDDAQTFIRRFFAMYRGVAKWHDDQLKKEEIRSLGGRVWYGLPQHHKQNKNRKWRHGLTTPFKRLNQRA